VPEQANITGDYLQTRSVSFDRQQRPEVAFQFNSEGGRIFGDLTAEHIGERLAIVLDNRVYSAPNIKSRIGSSGVIEGRFTRRRRATSRSCCARARCRSRWQIEEERTVGPALGADSISRGLQAAALGLGRDRRVRRDLLQALRRLRGRSR
jgi:preprotein translocase subunit SecD